MVADLGNQSLFWALHLFSVERQMRPIERTIAAILVAAFPATAFAQDGSTRTRVILGPQLTPSVPGSSDVSFGPFIEVGRARAGEVFEFEAPDESFGFPVASAGSIEFGPGKRTPAKIGANLPNVGGTFEAGAFAQSQISDALRLRAEVRRGIGGHDGWISELSADFVARDGDKWLVSIGPRVVLNDARYQRAYYGVTPAASLASGLAAYRPGGGISSVGLAVGALKQFGPRWGVAAYARYDRLVGDAGNSPIVRGPGSRNQPAVGLALSYVFGRTAD
jgi:MipA family protein